MWCKEQSIILSIKFISDKSHICEKSITDELQYERNTRPKISGLQISTCNRIISAFSYSIINPAIHISSYLFASSQCLYSSSTFHEVTSHLPTLRVQRWEMGGREPAARNTFTVLFTCRRFNQVELSKNNGIGSAS